MAEKEYLDWDGLKEVKKKVERYFRLETMPEPGEAWEDKIVQYIGESGAVYKNGYFYKCQYSGYDYEWVNKIVQPNTGQTIQYDTMPTANRSALGRIVQYVGTSGQQYTNGYFYECVEKEESGETVYVWENKLIQQGGDTRIGDEITNIKARFDDGFRPYITIDPVKVIGAFSDLSIEEVIMYASLYYNGSIPLEKIQESWSIGDSTSMIINATDKTAAQTVDVILVDINHDTLTTASGEITNALITVAFMFNENLPTGEVPYSTSTGKTWLEETCYNALPSSIKASIKQVEKQTDGGWTGKYGSPVTTTISSRLFIPSCPEFIGRNITQAECPTGGAAWRGATGGGTVYEYYKTSGNRSKNVITASSTAWLVDWNVRQVVAKPNNTAEPIGIGEASGFMPHFCI